MLIPVATVNSVAITGVSEAFGVHENSALSAVAQARQAQTVASARNGAETTVRISPPLLAAVSPFTDPTNTGVAGRSISVVPAGENALRVAPVAADLLPTLTGSVLLEQLGMLSSNELRSFSHSNAATIGRLIVSPPNASVTNSWWIGLSAGTQAGFARASPELVGNLAGIPIAARDAANRDYLVSSIRAAKRSLSNDVGRAKLVGKKHHLEILKQIERTLKATVKGEPRQLLTFDPSGDGRAAVVVGNLSTADYVSYLVPGMFFTVQGQMYDWTTIAQNLQTEQTGWLKILAKSDPAYRGKTAATVAWIGYSTPGLLDIASLARADQGADFLGNALDGVKSVRAGAEPFVTLVTHSYGTTAAMIELAKGGVSVDALAMIGSPGSATQTASALDVKNDNVYVGEAAWDPIVNTAFYGSDPGSKSFGAHRMDVAGGTDAITHKFLAPAIGHLGYFDPGSQAMRNLALVGLNQGALVTNGTLADADRTLAEANRSLVAR